MGMFDSMRNKKRTFDIFGSCVSRDLFTMPEAVCFECKEYIARQSVLSLLSEPLSVEVNEISALTSNFQKAMVLNDLRKTTFERLERSKSDYIIVDFIDERFRTAKISNIYLTMSNELMASGYLSGKDFQEVNPIRWKEHTMDEELKPRVAKLAETLCSIYKRSHIIIHMAKMVDNYRGKDGEIHKFAPNYIENNKRVNYLLDKMYDWLNCEILEMGGVINISQNYLADENHKWGLSTMHFQQEYYQDVVKEIEKIVGRNIIQKSINQLRHIKRRK